MYKFIGFLAFAVIGCAREAAEFPAAAQAPASRTSSQPPQRAPEVEGPELRPVDEAASDPTLVAFRQQLLDAVHRRDRDVLLSAIDPDIRTTFGPGGGIEDFRKQWSGDEIWAVLEGVLTRGGTWQKGSEVKRFWAPYVFSAWPDGHDAFEELAVTANDVPLREAADPNSNVMATLRWDIVTRTDAQSTTSGAPFMKVRTADGREGWVETKYLRSPIDYRAGLVKTGEGWKIEALVAGD